MDLGKEMAEDSVTHVTRRGLYGSKKKQNVNSIEETLVMCILPWIFCDGEERNTLLPTVKLNSFLSVFLSETKKQLLDVA